MPTNRPYNLSLMFISGCFSAAGVFLLPKDWELFFHPMFIAVQAEYYPIREGLAEYFIVFLKIFDFIRI